MELTNDTSTLNGALQELGETMAANLTSQGVTASASDGLTTLAGKILDITPSPTPTPASISLTSDKSVLSYADSESATLSATVLDEDSNPCEGVSVEFFKGSTSLGTASTNSSGVATKTYASAGSGDLSFTAGVGSLVSESFAIQDCSYWNDGSSVGSLDYDTGTSCTSNGEYISFGTSTSGEKYCRIPVVPSSDFELEYEVAKLGTSQTSALAIMYGASDYVLCRPNGNKISVDGSQIGTNSYSRDFQANDVINWKYTNGTLLVTLNGSVTLYNHTVTLSNISVIRWYTNQGRMQHFKNIKLKPL